MKSLRDYEERLFRAVNPAVRFSVTRYVFAIGLFAGIVLFGLVSLLGLGIDLLPSINIPVVAVFTSYPGATPGVVDLSVTQVIENSVSTISGITDMNSKSFNGTSIVILQFNPSVNQDGAANEVAAQVATAVRRLPTGASAPIVHTFNPNSQPILEFGIYGGTSGLVHVSSYVQNVLTPLLERVNGVANVQISGNPSREFEVLLNPSELAYYHITPTQVVDAITSSAVNQSIGSIDTHGNMLTFATQNVPTNLAAISNIGVNVSKDITVSDVATVRDAAVASNFARINGRPVVLVSIQQTATSNAVAVAAAVRKFIATLQLPTGYHVIYSNDTTIPIRASVQATYHELFLTAAVVAFVVLLFLGRLNTAFSVILAVPIALSAAPILYRFLGFTLNLVSLLALIVAIGIVVDDSIVVAENVERHRSMGESRMQAVLHGASEVFSAVAAASLSMISVLLPVSFIGGVPGAFLQQFSLGLAAAVFFSWCEALLFLTVRLAYTPDSRPRSWRDFGASVAKLPMSIKWGFRAFRSTFGVVLGGVVVIVLLVTHHPIFIVGMILYPIILGALYYLGQLLLTFFEALTVTLHGWTEAGLEWVRSRYVAGLGKTLKFSPWVLLGAGAFFVVTLLVILPKIPFNFVPQSDNGWLRAFVHLPNGTPTTTTNMYVGRIERYLLSRPEVRTVQTVVGSPGVFGGASQADFARLVIQLGPINQRPSVFKLIGVYRSAIRHILRKVPSARAFVSAGGGFRGAGSSVTITLVSPNLRLLEKRNSAILSVLQSDKYVGDVSSSLSNTTLENDFVPSPSVLASDGLNTNSVAGMVQTYASGTQAGNVDVGGEEYPIWVQLDPRYLSGEQSLLTLPIYSSTLGQNLSLGQLGSFQLKPAPVQISRYNRLYTVQYSIDLRRGAPPVLAFQNRVRQELTKAGLIGNQITISNGSKFGPAALTQQLSFLGPLVFGISVLLAYLVMGAQFNSFRYPIYLLLPVPLALTGAMWFVFLMGQGLDVFGVLGMLMLIGLSAKNAILYLDFVVQRLGRMPFVDALIESARLRFRPIVMTTVTVLVISIPLIFSRGEGSEFGQRLGTVMLGGVLFSAVLTFFVVPSAFFLFERKRADQRDRERERLDEIRRAAEIAPSTPQRLEE